MILHTFISILAASNLSAPLEGPVLARIERVVDGDTVRVSADVWIDQSISVSVRVAGVDAPELFRPKCDAEKARARAAKTFVADFLGDDTVRLYDIRRGKYAGRVVARIETADGRDLGAALAEADHAVYGDRGKWCE
ncbi:MAG: hypothetical protein AAGJ87_04880 [Pseudomonadota bacterium]